MNVSGRHGIEFQMRVRILVAEVTGAFVCPCFLKGTHSRVTAQ